MPAFDDEPLSERLSAAIGNILGAVFLIGFTLFSGFCFVFGLAFIVAVVGSTIWGLLNGRPVVRGDPWEFSAIFVPVMLAYEYFSWRFFRFGLSVLRGTSRQHDPFDADGQVKRPPGEAE